MVRVILIFFLMSGLAYADLFDFGSEGSRGEKIPTLIEKLKGLDMKGPGYDDSFNQTVKGIESAVEEEKLYCSGEATDSQGKALAANQKQLCMRELKKHYLDAMDTIFELKKKYLLLLHQKQVEGLSEVQKKLKADIEKNF